MERAIKPLFPKDESDKLFHRIRERVNQVVSELESRRRKSLIAKAILFPSLYVAAWITAVIRGHNAWVLYGCYFVMGLLLVINFLNLVHDAAHGVLFQSKKWNRLYLRCFDLLGANSYIWSLRHTRLHHNYPNVMGWDSDVEQSSLARIFPHGPFSSIHKYQHIYLPFIYPLYLLNWLLVRDFKDYFSRKKIIWKVTDIPRREYVKLFFFKFLFLTYTIVIPKWLTGVSWGMATGAFLVMVFTASIFSLLVLLSPHANTENEFPLPDETNKLPYSWFIHQLRHTNDVAHDNWFIRTFMGNFNYHVAHHLFPAVPHVYYPEVTGIIREEAEKYGLPYKTYPLRVTLLNHYRLLKQNRQPFTIFDETM